MRKTKIICTLGPATDDTEVLEQLIVHGMDVARLNFSHGSHEEQGRRMQAVREAREKCGKPVAILLDTKGPEIRVRDFEGDKALLENGQEFTLTGREILGNSGIASITFPDLYKDVKIGTKILIDDGLIEMEVKELKDRDIVCTVLNGGYVSNHKGVNLPGVHINMEFLSAVDREDILFG
ncbi:MAG: pyruvate kinase, partial [Butyrivibrio sp.]|nr:pyruvate kinase [Butyrivibrio sp.]